MLRLVKNLQKSITKERIHKYRKILLWETLQPITWITILSWNVQIQERALSITNQNQSIFGQKGAFVCSPLYLKLPLLIPSKVYRGGLRFDLIPNPLTTWGNFKEIAFRHQTVWLPFFLDISQKNLQGVLICQNIKNDKASNYNHFTIESISLKQSE